MEAKNTPVTQLKNIGATVARRLNEIGIHTYADLEDLGAVNAYMRISANYPTRNMPVCYYLYSLEGALRDQHWDALPKALKDKLLQQTSQA